MLRRLMVASVIPGAILGLLVGLRWGTLVGTAVGIVVLVIGMTALVLRRNQRDLRELQQRHGQEKPGA